MTDIVIKNIADLFKNIREENISDAIKYIRAKSEDELDINIRDERGIYLINYAIIQNNTELLNAIIEKNPILDITDSDGRSLLYYPIKYNYSKIILILLIYNRSNIGISILDIKDKKGNIPLHYAIIYKNIECLKILLEEGSNVNIIDIDNNNSIHLAVYSKVYEICDIICKTDIIINAKNSVGENALHIACNLGLIEIVKLLLNNGIYIDTQDDDYEFSALHYSVNLNNIPITKLLVKNLANPNLQDFLGNTPLHYAIIEENYEIFNYLLTSEYTKNINVNIYNYENKLPIHIALEKNMVDFVKILIPGSNLNFQDMEGFSAIHYLFLNGTWKTIRDELKIKKINLFIKNKKNEIPLDYIDKNDIKEIIEIVSESYLYILRNYNSNWKEEWENKCNKELLLDNLDKDEIKLLEKYNVSKVKDQDICKEIIYNKIMAIYNKKEYGCGITSYPVKKNKICINLDNTSKVEFCSFTGITLDILIGLIYLLQKHSFASSTINANFIENDELCNYYKSIGIMTRIKCEFLNFEIVWIQQKLHFSTDFEKNFEQIIKKPKKRFIIIPLGIELKIGSHANYLLYDKKLNQIERFEPYGATSPPNFNYNSALLDQILKSKFEKLVTNIKYIKPSDYLPKIGFQFLDSAEKKSHKIGDPGGFCALWAIWYVDQRLTYYDIDRKMLVNKMLKEIKLRNISFKDLIRNYSKNIIKIREDIFSSANITINDWLNDQYNDKQINIIIASISQIIEKLIL